MAQPFETSEHIRMRSCIPQHFRRAHKAVQVIIFQSKSFISYSYLHNAGKNVLLSLFLSFFLSYRLIGTLLEGIDKPYKMRAVCGGNSRDIWPLLISENVLNS